MASLREQRIESGIDRSCHQNHLQVRRQHEVNTGEEIRPSRNYIPSGLGQWSDVAYSIAHIAHHDLGFARSALREQALICAALVAGLVAIEMLAGTER
jgi:hypothetical protein